MDSMRSSAAEGPVLEERERVEVGVMGAAWMCEAKRAVGGDVDWGRRRRVLARRVVGFVREARRRARWARVRGSMVVV
jgi:hypothetical protein